MSYRKRMEVVIFSLNYRQPSAATDTCPNVIFFTEGFTSLTNIEEHRISAFL
ncbi:MAG TPA: hypothetical protein VNN20_14240 [Thermodesulfobacteriota bacterium]|nr:hypothetical protein [Thermodesulfobacteriota bacterium]